MDIIDGLDIVEFGTTITLAGAMFQQITIQDIGAIRAGTKQP